ncbi:histone-lysine N-methyltransferase SETDB1 [Patella vulgata]|uniref:histone-lysine N-methyltransferase SETDB1 n=1 Tax=Patella vulgata TaxID=6465 RepID=UPI0024A99421|nr:histone-lysine N-methyltransferase SETDB1 [Patella vulgata]
MAEETKLLKMDDIKLDDMKLDDINLNDLNSLIETVFEDVIKSDVVKKKFESDLQPLNLQLRSVEKKKKEIDKIFYECETSLVAFKKEIENEEKEEEDRSNKAKIAAKVAADAQRRVDLVIDDDDDDIKFVSSTFEPSSNRRSSMEASARHAATQNTSMVKHSRRDSLKEPPPSVANLRQALTQAIQKQIPPGGVPPAGLGMSGAKPNQQKKASNMDDPTKWPEIKEGKLVYAKKYNDIWYPATVLELQGSRTDANGVQYRVRFQSRGHKVLTGKHIAYYEPIHVILRVGSRVIAFYRDDDSPGGNSYYAGIVAEAPSLKNQRRFLIFFDDGYAQYSKADEIHKVIAQSANVWEDVYPESQDFIRDYLKQYPERPMVRLQKGQGVQTEWNGKWWTAKVMEVDASLVKMYFQADRRTEWIYRGSTRLEPLFKALANLEANKNMSSNKGRRLDPINSRKPRIVYSHGNDDDKNSDKNRSVARKSTGGIKQQKEPPAWEAPWLKLQRKTTVAAPSHTIPSTATTSSTNRKDIYATSSISNKVQTQDMASVLQERLASAESMDIDEEARGERLSTILDIKDKTRKRLIPHSCSSACLKDVDEDISKHKGRNPLLKPLLCSWERHVCKIKQSGKRVVLYRTPCARRLRSIEEVDRYLQMTDSQLTIDLFCMDPFLHTHTEFVPVKTFCDIKDLSYGKENVPISCVNGIDRQYPDYVEYSTVRIPAKGVKLNLAPEFLPGCDCTDGCRDASKCACQQLSVEHSSALGEKDAHTGSLGYTNRRLNEPIFTGIVECNVNCKCDKRCHNRVVQNGLNLRLQVFKTEKRGWGLRCLDDIPKGGFICIYAGQLLTDTGANEDGKQYGDEYLAELDFIEVVERQKEGYESDVDDLDDEIEQDIDEEEEEEEEEEDFRERHANNSGSDSEFSAKVDDSHRLVDKVHATRNRRKTSDSLSGEGKITKIIIKRDQSNKEWISQKKTADWVGKIGEEGDKDDTDLDELPDIAPKPSATTKPSATATKKPKESARKSTGISRFGNLPNPKLHKTDPADDDEKKNTHPGTRSFFEDGQMCYIMDAKSMGNIGRYLNHSCEPNVFVQNIFVDTHDLRFPWVTFFAGTYIRAGTELTWDYNYEVGSVPDKVLYCYCGSSQCRGRLL